MSIPPESVRSTIDKTAAYVLKNGPTFEQRLRESSEKEKFAFLFEDSPFHAYYRSKIGSSDPKVLENGRPAKPQEAQKPPNLLFLTDAPPVSAEDADVIKITALFAAKNSNDYLKPLLAHQRKRGKHHQFEFLNEAHSLHKLFLQYVEQYKLVLAYYEDENSSSLQHMKEKLDTPEAFLDRAFSRAQYEKQHKQKLQDEHKATQDKQRQYVSIDWQDFALVGKIEFSAVDRVTELAVPLKKDDLVYRSLLSKNQALELATAKPDPAKLVKAVEKEALIGPQPKGMKIRAAGESRLKRNRDALAAENMIKCPLTEQLIPELKFDTHLRVLLRDPRYKEQQENYLRKNFTYASNLTTDQVYENIQRLARKLGVSSDEPVKKRPQIGPQ